MIPLSSCLDRGQRGRPSVGACFQFALLDGEPLYPDNIIDIVRDGGLSDRQLPRGGHDNI